MRGYRNLAIACAGLGCTTWIALAGIHAGSDLVGLATVIGAVWCGCVGAVYGRGFNKGKEALNGGVQ